MKEHVTTITDSEHDIYYGWEYDLIKCNDRNLNLFARKIPGQREMKIQDKYNHNS